MAKGRPRRLGDGPSRGAGYYRGDLSISVAFTALATSSQSAGGQAWEWTEQLFAGVIDFFGALD